jgi:hypothetical protein
MKLIDVGKQLCYGAALLSIRGSLARSKRRLGGLVMRELNCMVMTWLISVAPLADEPKRSRVR